MVSMSQQTQQQDGWAEELNRGIPGQSHETRLDSDGRALLARAVRDAVIPELVASPWIRAMPQPARAVKLDTDSRATLTALCLGDSGMAAQEYVSALHARGVPAVVLYEELLAEVARELGTKWEQDECSFADVTIGVLRLQNAQRALAPDFVGGAAPRLGAPRALLMAAPGGQHTFGLSIVLDFFLRAGWEARIGQATTEAEAVALVRRERYDVVGLSFACDDLLPTAHGLIAAMRLGSAHRGLQVMVGGPAFSTDSTLAASIGADATAIDGQQAVVRANELLLATAERA